MRWEKLGQVHVASGQQDWSQTHAFLPTVLPLGTDRLRVFVAFLDREKVGRLGWVDVAASDPTRVLTVSEMPALDVGPPGRFDDNGITPLSVFKRDGRTWLYYAGWQLGVQIRYFLFTGLAFSEDDGETFERYSAVPVLDRSDAEPTLRTGGFFEPFAGGIRAWYMAGASWVSSAGRLMPTYDMHYADSIDGTTWPGQGQLSMEAQRPAELGFGRPCILHEDGISKIWYGLRLRDIGYRIGYAESADGGRTWLRLDDQAGIGVSPSGWDSQTVGYPWVSRTPHGTWLFYNGNNYGETGFGVARLSS